MPEDREYYKKTDIHHNKVIRGEQEHNHREQRHFTSSKRPNRQQIIVNCSIPLFKQDFRFLRRKDQTEMAAQRVESVSRSCRAVIPSKCRQPNRLPKPDSKTKAEKPNTKNDSVQDPPSPKPYPPNPPPSPAKCLHT